MKKKINEQTLLFGLPIPFNDEVKLYQPTLKEILEEDLGFEEIIAPFIIMDKKNFDENSELQDFDYYFVQIILGYIGAMSNMENPMELDEWIKSPEGEGLVIVRLIRVLRFLFKTDDIAINISEDSANGLGNNYITINKSYKIDRDTYFFLKDAVCKMFDTDIKIEKKEEKKKSEEELYWERIFEEKKKQFEEVYGEKKEKNRDKINIFTLINYILHNKNSRYDYNSIQNLTIYQIKNTFKYYQSLEMYDVDMMYRTSGQFKIDNKGEHWFFDKS